MVALKRACGISLPLKRHSANTSLLGAGVFGHSLGPFRDGVLGQLTGKKQTDGRLDLAARDGAALVVLRQARSLSRDTLENVVHERVHDGHSFGADTGIGVDLLEDLVDVAAVRFLALLAAFLVAGARGRFLAGLFGGLGGNFWRHAVVDRFNAQYEISPRTHFYYIYIKNVLSLLKAQNP